MNFHTLRSKARLVKRMPLLYRNWATAVVCMGIRREKPVVLQLRDGTQFCVRMRGLDTYIIDEIWIDHIYTPQPEYSIRDGWTIIDAGGHKGIFAAFAATRAKNVKVYTFEPSPRNFAVLCENLRMNGISNVRAFNVAVGSHDGDSVLDLYPDDGQNSMLRRSTMGLEPLSSVRVQTWSLHHVIQSVASTINLLKMDIEGMEYESLFSCSNEILKKVERIAVEYHERIVHVSHNVSELVHFLNLNGFSTRLQVGHEILLAKRPVVDMDAITTIKSQVA